MGIGKSTEKTMINLNLEGVSQTLPRFKGTFKDYLSQISINQDEADVKYC